MKDKTKFQEMFELDISAHTETLDTGSGFKPTYLSWSSAILLASENYEGFDYNFVNNFDGTPVFYNELVDGYFVKTEVTIDSGLTWKPMSLPIMDNRFKPQGKGVRTYTAKGQEKKILPANSFDVNYSQMRCLAKNISVATGIGLKLYFKESKFHAIERDKIEREAEEKRLQERNIKIETIKIHEMYTKEVRTYIKDKKKLDIGIKELETMSETNILRVIPMLDALLEKKNKNNDKE